MALRTGCPGFSLRATSGSWGRVTTRSDDLQEGLVANDLFRMWLTLSRQDGRDRVDALEQRFFPGLEKGGEVVTAHGGGVDQAGLRESVHSPRGDAKPRAYLTLSTRPPFVGKPRFPDPDRESHAKRAYTYCKVPHIVVRRACGGMRFLR